MPRTPFITPAAPVLGREPPIGPEWLHEVKLDGFRGQLHRRGEVVTIFWKGGTDVTGRYPHIARALLQLRAESFIIDCELVACDREGQPNFYAMLGGAKHGCCAYCFDIMELEGELTGMLPLVKRRQILTRLLKRLKPDALRLSEAFDNPLALLAECEKRGLEGIVSKLRDDRYRAGKNRDWIKVKTTAWREANRDRRELFEKPARRASG